MEDDDEHYLKAYKPGTYRRYKAGVLLKEERAARASRLETWQKSKDKANTVPGAEEKFESVKTLLAEYEELEKEMLAAGAKTHKELHPDIELPPKNPPYKPYHYKQNDHTGVWEVKFEFRSPDASEEKKEGLADLYVPPLRNNLHSFADIF